MESSEFKDNLFDIYEDSVNMSMCELFEEEMKYDSDIKYAYSHSGGMLKLEPQDHHDQIDHLEINSDEDHCYHTHGKLQSAELNLMGDMEFPGSHWSTSLDQAVLNDDPMMSVTSQQSISNTDHCYSNSASPITTDQACRRRESHHTLSGSKVRLISTCGTSDRPHTYATSGRPGRSHTYATSSRSTLQIVKQEPKIITVNTRNQMVIAQTTSCGPTQSLLKQNNHNPLVKVLRSDSSAETLVYPITRIKSEPGTYCEDEDVYIDSMPMTPPSSNQNSDSEGGTSPRHTPPTSPVRQVLVARASGYRYNPATAIYSQPIPTSGILRLTVEEKRTFISEGYPLPTRLPLNKTEERNLKKVRRKIKNKISAQESRRKKKEYMDQLERKVDDIVKENTDLKQKCDNYESNNRSLLSQLNKLQTILKKISPRQVTTQTGVSLLVMVMCFAVFIGNWTPFSSWPSLADEGVSGGAPSSMLDNSLREGNPYISTQLRSSRTLAAYADDASYNVYEEPWPISLARRSIQWTFSLLNAFSTVTPVVDGSSFSNPSL